MIGLLSKLIPEPYRVVATLAILALWSAILVAGAGTVGWKVSRWRADAHWSEVAGTCATNLATANASVSSLTASLENQNRAVQELREKSDAITAAQEAARKAAASEAAASARRIAEMQHRLAQGATCDQALQGYWESQP